MVLNRKVVTLKMKCAKCKNEMIFFTEGQCCGWKCPYCGDYLVTTCYSETETDKNKYSVSVSGSAEYNISKIKAVKEVLNCSFPEAKDKLTLGFTINDVSATSTAKIIKTLKIAGVFFNTLPEFPHKA